MAKHILLVDDDDDLCFVTKLALERFGGFTVAVEMTAESALSNLVKHEPDLILLDVMLPGMSGMAMFSIMRNIKSYQSIPVLFLTARVLHRQRAEMMALGVNGIIAKPFDPHDLVARVNQALDEAAAAAAGQSAESDEPEDWPA